MPLAMGRYAPWLTRMWVGRILPPAHFMSISLAAAPLPLATGLRHPDGRARNSVVFVVPPGRTVSGEQLAATLPAPTDRGTEFVVLLSEALQARDLQRRRRDLRCVTASADADLVTLRESGMREATGNIVTLIEVTAAAESQWLLHRALDSLSHLGLDDVPRIAASTQ
jgi:hypothetical protein